jgi:hypothetical protein
MSEEVKQDVILVDNEYITVKYDPEHKFIHHTVHKPVEGWDLRNALLAGSEALKKYGASKWLSDDRLNGPISDEDREWGVENWNIPTIEAGWKYWALVVPTEVVAAGSLVPVMSHWYELGLRMMVFSSMDKAVEWLDNVDAA